MPTAVEVHAGPLERACNAALQHLDVAGVVQRIWARDYTVWRDEPREITDRLGWLDLPARHAADAADLGSLGAEVAASRARHVVLVGMGGSSLAPQVLVHVHDPARGDPQTGAPGHPALVVADSTVPAAVRDTAGLLGLDGSYFIAASKSGSTTETVSLMRYLFRRETHVTGGRGAADRFVAITDPGSPLEAEAQALGFRRVFHGDPDVGGRFSALSAFGLVPAAMAGVDPGPLLESGAAAAAACGAVVPVPENPGAVLGAYLGAMVSSGRDKLTVLASAGLEAVGDWVEQLIAESTGKDGAGLLPVVGESALTPVVCGADRCFVAVRRPGDSELEGALRMLEEAGLPLAVLDLESPSRLGWHFFVWEMATAVLGYLMKIHPFDQPNVEAAKVRARENLEQYRKTGAVPTVPVKVRQDGIALAGDVEGETLEEALGSMVGDFGPGPGRYLCVQAFLPPRREVRQELESLRVTLRDRSNAVVTTGFGPRFLHSTGQLHKGDAGKGRFLQLVCDAGQDVPIPDSATSDDSSVTFGALVAAQSVGDYEALVAAGRRVLRADLGGQVEPGIRRLIAALGR